MAVVVGGDKGFGGGITLCYKEADDYSKRLLPEPTTCQIIRELNPGSIYYDVYSRRVNVACSTQFLFESCSNGTSRVLFVME